MLFWALYQVTAAVLQFSVILVFIRFELQLGKEAAKYDCETVVTLCDTQCWPLSENQCLTCPSNQTQFQVKSKLTRILSVSSSLCLLHVLPYIILELTTIVSQVCDDMVCFQWRLSFQPEDDPLRKSFHENCVLKAPRLAHCLLMTEFAWHCPQRWWFHYPLLSSCCIFCFLPSLLCKLFTLCSYSSFVLMPVN